MELYAIWIIRRSCTDKVPYVSKGAARANGRRLSRRWHLRYKPYRCDVCGYWHLKTRRIWQ